MKSMELSLNEKCTKIIGNKFLNLYGGVKQKEGVLYGKSYSGVCGIY